MAKLAVFASGEGTNFQALVDASRSGWLPAQVALLVASKKDIGALRRAKEAGIDSVVLEVSAFGSAEAYGAALAQACRDKGADFICLAGWLQLLPPSFIKAFPGRILNIHPALLPGFGGKGMYGLKVHQAVIESGAKVSGCTVHLVDEQYDNGPIVLQSPVPVAEGDTAETLAARVQEAEHYLYPKAARLFCEGRVQAEGRRVAVKPETAKPGQVKRALLSVSDKAGLIELARGLSRLGVEIVSTGGTAKALKAAGLFVRPLDTLTQSPEMLGGRVKTLHPKVHGGILFKRNDPEHVREAGANLIEPIDLVVVNLYPFAEAAKKHAAFEPELIEEIDIGGPTLVRAAAKNCDSVGVVTSPSDYAEVLKELEAKGELTLETRRRLARKAFLATAEYDAMIAQVLAEKAPGLPPSVELRLDKVQDLRYGENPHQAGALYRVRGSERPFEQLQGKELSYNNLLDAEGSWELACEFDEPAAAFFKHVTPCGAGTGLDLLEAYRRAWEGDTLSAFGGILAVNRPLDAAVAQAIGDFFLEVIVAPAFTPEALEILKKKKNLRLLVRKDKPGASLQLRVLGTEVLVQEPDRLLWSEAAAKPAVAAGAAAPAGAPAPWKVVTKRVPTAEEAQALRFAWPVCKHVRSNAIVVAAPGRTIGIGAGQMSRVDAVQVAAMKMQQYFKKNAAPPILAAASDAFFPFRDGVDEIAKLGATAIAQPGGSVRDDEVIAAADEYGMAMVFTGVRHFRH